MGESDKDNSKGRSVANSSLQDIEDRPLGHFDDDDTSEGRAAPESEAVTRAREFMKAGKAPSSEEPAQGHSHTRLIVVSVLSLLVGFGAAYTAFATGLVTLPGAETSTVATESTPTKPKKVVTSPSTTAQTYTSPVDGASFSYPKDWELSKSKESLESLTLSPSSKIEESDKGFFAIGYIRHIGGVEDVANIVAETSYSVADVSYEKLPDSTANVPLYVQKTILKRHNTTSDRYYTKINLSTTNSLKVGDVIPDSQTVTKSFFINNEKDSISFVATLNIKDSDGLLGTATLEASQDFIKDSAVYKQAKDILLSFKATH